jgi:hypothetical protein
MCEWKLNWSTSIQNIDSVIKRMNIIWEAIVSWNDWQSVPAGCCSSSSSSSSAVILAGDFNIDLRRESRDAAEVVVLAT